MSDYDYLDQSGEESENDLEIDYLSKISDVVPWSTDWTVETLIGQIEKGNIDLTPPFQRRDAWNVENKSRFIESLIYGLPIPQIVLAEKKESRGKFIIVDGKQRLLTIFQYLSKEADRKFALKGLKNLELIEKTSESLSESNPDLYSILLNQSIRSVILKNWVDEDFLYTIFYRLNTGSLKLSPQELRFALRPGPFMKYVEEFSRIKEIKEILKIKNDDYRMRDVDLAIRYFTFTLSLEQYNGNYKQYLDKFCDICNKEWSNGKQKEISESAAKFLVSYNKSKIVFGEHVFHKFNKGEFENRINRAIFDIMMFYFCNDDIANAMVAKKEEVISAFIKLCSDNYDFQKSLSSNTNNMTETSTRYYIWANTLSDVLGFEVYVPKNLKEYYLEEVKK